MKRNIFLCLLMAIAISTVTFAQNPPSGTAEIPRNYKPVGKALLPMPDSLTERSIFPVLGEYELSDKNGNMMHISINKDFENKGLVWINGLPQGKFNAVLKASPATYKIPKQKAIQNDSIFDDAGMVEDDAKTKKMKKNAVEKSIQEGTIIYDKEANRLYVNIGSKFNEDNPAYIFPEMSTTDSTLLPANTETKNKEDKTVTSTTRNKLNKIKSITYTGAKINAGIQTTPAEEDDKQPAAAPISN